jgi:hypothetical protein
VGEGGEVAGVVADRGFEGVAGPVDAFLEPGGELVDGGCGELFEGVGFLPGGEPVVGDVPEDAGGGEDAFLVGAGGEDGDGGGGSGGDLVEDRNGHTEGDGDAAGDVLLVAAGRCRIQAFE